MKKLLLVMLSFSLVGLVSCGGEKTPPAPPTPPDVSLDVTPSSLSFEAKGETKTITITTTGSWTLTSSADWCVLSHGSGTGNLTINVAVSANTGLDTRSTTITVKQGTTTKQISVSQLGEAPDILVDQTPIQLNRKESNFMIAVTTNIEYDIVISDNWIEQQQTKTMIKYTHNFVAKENFLFDYRQATITFRQKNGGAISKIVTIKQDKSDNSVYTVESFKAQMLPGVYISNGLTFVYDDELYQISSNATRKTQRIQTYNQDTIVSVVLSELPSDAQKSIDVVYDNVIKGKSTKKNYSTSVVRLESDKAWLWNEENKLGFVVSIVKK